MHCDILNVARRRGAVLGARGLLIAGLAAALAGCNTTTAQDTTGSIPLDYRERHPIAVKEGKKTLVLFVSSGRGGLSPQQRAEVLAFAQNWKRDATGGVTIDRPVGGANERAAGDTLKEALSIIVQAGVPNNGIGIRTYNSDNKLGALRLITRSWSRTPAPAGCGPTTSARATTPNTSRTGNITTSAARRSAIWLRWRPSQPTLCSPAPRAPPTPPSAPSASTNGARVTARRRPIPMAARARSAMWANDQNGTAERHV
jgi:pilus biogenesis lipoprotein CpaD